MRLLAVAAILLTTALAVPEPAQAAGGYCPDANGVTVVVDLRPFGGGVLIQCAPGAQANGVAALAHAGYEGDYVYDFNNIANDFVLCNINGKPGVDQPTCEDNALGSKSFWSSWSASNGGSWTLHPGQPYIAAKPPTGGFVGWSFAAGVAPPPGVAPVRPGSAAHPKSAPAQPLHRRTPAASASTAPSGRAPAATAPAVTPPGAAVAGERAGRAARPIADEATRTRAGGIPAGALGAVIAALLVTAFSVLAAISVWRHRRAGPVDGGSPEAARGSAAQEEVA
ncbi:MAG: hypothetical protein J2P15_10420, partial [Micromonosporaceae bacterium]|nr:hypothetical protein [Micromonosporaceae bacterium]